MYVSSGRYRVCIMHIYAGALVSSSSSSNKCVGTYERKHERCVCARARAVSE
jgi:hypothetical protein